MGGSCRRELKPNRLLKKSASHRKKMEGRLSRENKRRNTLWAPRHPSIKFCSPLFRLPHDLLSVHAICRPVQNFSSNCCFLTR